MRGFCVHAAADECVVWRRDELGRGTSTFDGYAIASAALQYLSDHVGCRVLFATHYHALTQQVAGDPRVTAQHMAAHVHTPIPGAQGEGAKLVFLYQVNSSRIRRISAYVRMVVLGVLRRTVLSSGPKKHGSFVGCLRPPGLRHRTTLTGEINRFLGGGGGCM